MPAATHTALPYWLCQYDKLVLSYARCHVSVRYGRSDGDTDDDFVYGNDADADADDADDAVADDAVSDDDDDDDAVADDDDIKK